MNQRSNIMYDLPILPCCEHITRKKWKHLPHEKALSGVTIIIVDVVNRIDTAVVYAFSLCLSSVIVTWPLRRYEWTTLASEWAISFGYDTIHSGMTIFIRVWHYSFGYVTIVGVFHYLFGYVTNYSGMSLIIRVSLISARSIRVTTISEKWKISDKARHSIGFVK